jgi:DNA-binding FrmR family transcriptional regulator
LEVVCQLFFLNQVLIDCGWKCCGNWKITKTTSGKKTFVKISLTDKKAMFIIPQGGIIVDTEKKKIITRLKRIEGQVRGLQRLVEDGALCVDVLTQVSAVTSAMKKAGAVIISTHMKTCLSESAGSKGKERDDFQAAISRFIDLS